MKTAKENIVDTLTGKKVLFIENDNGLHNGLDAFETVLKDAGITYNTIFNVSECDLNEVLNLIACHDCIVFQTQWVYEVSKKLHGIMKASTDKKIVVEVFIHEPTWSYAKQHGSIHDVYIFSYDEVTAEYPWTDKKGVHRDGYEFYKLTDKAYWDYENNFDK